MTPSFTAGDPGIYHGIPAAEYHAGLGISQSMLKAFDDAGSPAHYKALGPRNQTEDMSFGSLVHTAVLEPHLFRDAYYMRPAEYPDAKGAMSAWSGNAKWCREWTKVHTDKPVIKDRETLDRIVNCGKAIREHPVIGGALQHGKTEVSFLVRDEQTGMLLRSRCDLLSEDDTGIVYNFDLKKSSVGGGCEREFQKKVIDFGYHIQAAFYHHVTAVTKFVFVVYDDDAPFDVALWTLMPDFLELGRMEYRRILNAYAECLKTGEWIGYGDIVKPLPMPPWCKRRVLEINQAEHDLWLKQVQKSQ